MTRNRFLAVLLLFIMVMAFVSTTFAPVAHAGIESITLDAGADKGYVKASNTAADFNWSKLLEKYKSVITGIAGVAALTFLIFFIMNFAKLGASAGNPQQRSQSLMGIVWCGIACAALGGIAIFFGFFYGALTRS